MTIYCPNHPSVPVDAGIHTAGCGGAALAGCIGGRMCRTLIRALLPLCLIDCEFGALRHAPHDGVYGRIRFPTCWCVGEIPQPVVERMEATSREALAASWPLVEEERAYRGAVAGVCAG